MPQPLSRVMPKGCTVFIGNNTDNPADHRPKLALLAMKVIAEWSILDSFLNGLFVHMLGANPRPATAIYTALTGSAAQNAAFQAIADLALKDEQEKDIYAALLALLNKASKGRNKIAHWVWGHSPQVPDGVLLCDPVVLIEHRVEATARSESGNRERLPFPTDQMFVFNEADFNTMSAEIQRLIGIVSTFRFLVNRYHPANANDETLHQLLQVPEIRAFLDRLNERRKNAQAAQPQSPPAG